METGYKNIVEGSEPAPYTVRHYRETITPLKASIITSFIFGVIGQVIGSLFLLFVAALILILGVTGVFYLKKTDSKWRSRKITSDDIRKIRGFLKDLSNHDIKISSIPVTTAEMTNGELADWLEKVDEEIKSYHREVLIRESDRLGSLQ